MLKQEIMLSADRGRLRALAGPIWRTGAWLLLSLVVGCSSSRLPRSESLPNRYFAVQSALSASGLVQRGAVSRGKIKGGTVVRFPLELSGDCVTLVALGAGGARDLKLSVKDAKGRVVAEEQQTGPDASVRFCPEHAGKYQAALAMKDGQGTYSFSVWAGGGEGAGRTRASASKVIEGGGTCDAPTLLEPGKVYIGDTAQGESQEQGSCATGDGPELVYRLDVTSPTELVADMSGSFDTVLYLRKGLCSDPEAEVECNDDAPSGPRKSHLEANLTPGTYFLFADSYTSESGRFRLQVNLKPAKTSANPCESAPVLAIGETVSGNLLGRSSQVRASCGGHATGPERVFRVDLPSFGRVRFSESVKGGAPVLHVAQSCHELKSTESCATGKRDSTTFLIGTLDAGPVYVAVDSNGSSSERFMVRAETAPKDGLPVPGDSCSSALPLDQQNPKIRGDTFYARADQPLDGMVNPDVFYRLDVRKRARFDAVVSSKESVPKIALLRTCGDVGELIMSGSYLSAALEPGSYWMQVGSTVRNGMGRFEVEYRLRDQEQLVRKCESAPSLQRDREVSALLGANSDSVASKCLGSAASQDGGDDIYKLVLRERSRVSLRLTAPPGVRLSLGVQEGSCEHLGRGNVMVPCRLATKNGVVSITNKPLAAGTHFVVVDGATDDSPIRYRLKASWRSSRSRRRLRRAK